MIRFFKAWKKEKNIKIGAGKENPFYGKTHAAESIEKSYREIKIETFQTKKYQ
jgi:hypothetical protein